MPVVKLTAQNFEEYLMKTPMIMIDFASDRPASKEFSSIFDAQSEKTKLIVFGRVDTAAEKDIVEGFGITKTPTLLMMKEGNLYREIPGGVDEGYLKAMMDELRELDMDALPAASEKNKKD